MKLFVLCLLITLVFTTFNYHERNVYYSDADNVCNFRGDADDIILKINLNNR